ncbi:hypothetical protein OEV98_09760 [Caldibacillus lycopersici]|uniref:Uncharacterized protein n=1 Tax=Perspicuibacillus lycopersici TaxID=1325689 RepID=A0AAE3ITF0_9BACI|nr:SA1362 family protein [Perspicuibacillus lycopersici]MCU9613847.1 hypothetical protein [Perspicuibacillus lycopersici]
MKSKYFAIVFYSLLMLAVIGLFANPLRIGREILITIAIVAIIFLLFRHFAAPVSPARKEQRAFIHAARRSKRRLKKQLSAKQQMKKNKKAIRKSYPSHLTVIEGKKGKKKNRALH